jgi:predicted DNA repair protein MutK
MAFSSLFTLLDDITTILDDVAVLSKVAAKKTTGVLGDDLALNAEQVSGVKAEREIPVVWAVAKGSFRNKAILVPSALVISYFAPWLIVPLLMIGGAYLCFEGSEKLAHKWLHAAESHTDTASTAPALDTRSESEIEQEKIQGAIRTDFVLSAEIIVISLGTVASAPMLTQILTLVALAILMTIGVYGLVAGIVKLDDLGFWLARKGPLAQKCGRGILAFAPWMMRGLSVLGTIAMFLVGGGILAHGLPWIHHLSETLHSVPYVGFLLPTLLDGLVGLCGGFLLVLLWWLAGKIRKKATH